MKAFDIHVEVWARACPDPDERATHYRSGPATLARAGRDAAQRSTASSTRTGLQAIEASVGIGIGLVFLGGRGGLSRGSARFGVGTRLIDDQFGGRLARDRRRAEVKRVEPGERVGGEPREKAVAAREASHETEIAVALRQGTHARAVHRGRTRDSA